MGVIQNIVDEIKAISLKFEKLKKESVSLVDIKNALVERGLYNKFDEIDIQDIPYCHFIAQGKNFGSFLASGFVAYIYEFKNGTWNKLEKNKDYIEEEVIYSVPNTNIQKEIGEDIKLINAVTQTLSKISVIKTGQTKLKIQTNFLTREFEGTIDKVVTNILNDSRWCILDTIYPITNNTTIDIDVINSTDSPQILALSSRLDGMRAETKDFGFLYNKTTDSIHKTSVTYKPNTEHKDPTDALGVTVSGDTLFLSTNRYTFYLAPSGTDVLKGAKTFGINEGDELVFIAHSSLDSAFIEKANKNINLLPNELKNKGYI